MESRRETFVVELKAEGNPGMSILTIDMVAGSREGKCGLKYVMFTQSRKSTELFVPSAGAPGSAYSRRNGCHSVPCLGADSFVGGTRFFSITTT